MSRTFRRNKQHLIHIGPGTFAENEQDPSWLLNRKAYRGLTLRQAYDRAKARFHRDRHSGAYHVPSWFVRMYFTRPERAYNRQELQRCVRADEWDDHLPLRYKRCAAWFWF